MAIGYKIPLGILVKFIASILAEFTLDYYKSDLKMKSILFTILNLSPSLPKSLRRMGFIAERYQQEMKSDITITERLILVAFLFVCLLVMEEISEMKFNMFTNYNTC